MLRLFLLRHAKSAWPANVADRDRPLNGRGRKAAPVVGGYMEQHGLIPALALVSPARRTLETFAEATRGWTMKPAVAFEEAIYEAPAERLVGLLRSQASETPLMMVGHNPGMEDFAALLITPHERAKLPAKYPTGALAVIDLPVTQWADVEPRTGTLERFVAPRALGLGPEED